MAPGNNYGLGFIAAGVNENIVEDNIIVGNVHGIRLVAGAEKNVFRRNLVVGNPAVQESASNASVPAYDILNLAATGANIFDDNVCLTALNGPCPAVARSLAAFPNPIPVTGSEQVGATTITWNAPGVDWVQVRVGKPDGALLAEGGSRGSVRTEFWVSDGLTFFLQDLTGGKPLTAANTLATLVVRLERRP